MAVYGILIYLTSIQFYFNFVIIIIIIIIIIIMYMYNYSYYQGLREKTHNRNT